MDQIDIVSDFLNQGKIIPIIDVRSPSEFLQGHIPGATNLPLFDDEERKIVGTTYVQIGKQEAIDIGVDIALPKTLSLVQQARKIAGSERKLLVHCWRGGMRSASMAALFNLSGLHAITLNGGYKAYRRHIHDSFEKSAKLVVIGGLTGTGKSRILEMLKEQGEQVLDLEGIANHKGSAFGGIGRTQNTNEQFENNLYEAWKYFDLNKHIFLEDESLKIGKNIIPEPIFKKMKETVLLEIEIPRQERLKRILAEYGQFSKEDLIESCSRVKKRLGLENFLKAETLITNGDIAGAANILLEYYDKTYYISMAKRTSPVKIIKVNRDTDFERLCGELPLIAESLQY
jgi:tRNA 2-selenouridine synthase